MTVTLPPEIGTLLDDPASPDVEVRTRLAAHFYSLGRLSVGKAAEMAGMKRWEFEQWLRDHNVDMPWTGADLEQELASARKLGVR